MTKKKFQNKSKENTQGVTLIITIIEFFFSKAYVLRRRFRNDEITIRNQRAEKTVASRLDCFYGEPHIKDLG